MSSEVGAGTAVPPDGVSVALLTPVTEAGAVDGPALDGLVAHAIDGGVAGFAPAGSTGEGLRLSRAQRREVVARVVTVAGGRPVLAGVPSLAPDDTLAEVAVMAEVGADAALLTPPGMYALSGDELAEHFERLASASPLPLLLYHIPALAGSGFPPEVVGRLARHPRIAGLKDSGRDLAYLRSAIDAASDNDFRVVTGNDTQLAESLAAGAVGAIVASPNVAPALTASIDEALRRSGGSPPEADQARLERLVAACRQEGFPAGWKAAAAVLGRCRPDPVPPGHPLGPDGRGRLAETLRALGLS